MYLILIILLVLLLLGTSGGAWYGYTAGPGPYWWGHGFSLVGLVLFIALIVLIVRGGL